MSQINITYFQSPYGELIIGSYNNQLCLCDWHHRKMRESIDRRICQKLEASFVEQEDDVIKMTIAQLQEYFNGSRKDFDIPLLFCGTDFQNKVWNELLHISYGSTSTYMKQALKLNNKEAIRAVASANGANAISIIVPCHRIIGTNGDLIGYAGGLSTKQKLLTLENSQFNKNESQQQLIF